MIRINQLKMPVEHTMEDVLAAAAKTLKLPAGQIGKLTVCKKSIDARKKHEIKYIYAVDVAVKDEDKVIKKAKNANVTKSTSVVYKTTITGEEEMKERPIVVGSGPAGLFCAYFLAKNGYRPILIERGQPVEERIQTVEEFWKSNVLNPECNVQFGEGGAGTFSDGKLNTMVKDTFGRIRKVLEIFVEHGANEEILSLNKPHIGTDHLRGIVKNMRNDIIRNGGSVLFSTKLTDIKIKDEHINSIIVEQTKPDGTKEQMEMPCETLILAIGHSARDTFTMIYDKGIQMEKKAFAVGVRMEHKQEMINHNQYGDSCEHLPTADYKVTYQAKNGRAVYSFCMCPGGYVVNASSEEGRLAVNGMSYHDRAGDNANSAIIVTVNEKDYLAVEGVKDTPLAGMEFQRHFEALAYQTGHGNVPVQLFSDLLNNRKSDKIGSIQPNIKGKYELANLRDCLPPEVADTICEGVLAFDHMIPGFADGDAILSGVEMRTSSPVRITRDEHMESNLSGIYPCGEGAGYAGGITSAAVDGIKVFEAIASRYHA